MSKLFEVRYAAMTAKMDAAMRIKEGIVSSSDDIDTDTQDNSDDDTTTSSTTAKRGKGKATAKRAISVVDDSTTDNNNANTNANNEKTATKGKQQPTKKARHSDSGTIKLVNNKNSSDGTDTDDDEPMFEPDATEGNHTYCTSIYCYSNHCIVMCRSSDIVL
jgi:hypothetical protein